MRKLVTMIVLGILTTVIAPAGASGSPHHPGDLTGAPLPAPRAGLGGMHLGPGTLAYGHASMRQGAEPSPNRVRAAPAPPASVLVTPADCVLPGDDHCEAWTATMDSGNSDSVLASAASPLGDRVFVSGIETTGSAADFLTVALNAAGTELWRRRYAGPAGRADYPLAATVTPDGATVVVAGMRDENANARAGDAVLVADDAATGAEQWVATYDGGGSDMAMDVEASPDGRTLYATAVSTGAGDLEDYDYATIAVDRATGTLTWATRTSSIVTGGNDQAFAVAVSPDGSSVVATGWLESTAAPRRWSYGTVGYDAETGETQWISRYAAPGTLFSAAYDVQFSPDSSLVFVTGNAQRPDFPRPRFDYGTVAYDAGTGAQVWADHYDFSDGCEQCWTYWLGVAPDGTVYVGGSVLVPVIEDDHDGFHQMDFATVAYDGETGQRKWVSVYDGYDGLLMMHQGGGSTAVSPDGRRVYLTGLTQLNSTRQLTTVALDATTGSTVWEARIPELGIFASTILATPERIFIVSSTTRPGPCRDLQPCIGASPVTPYASDFLVAAYEP